MEEMKARSDYAAATATYPQMAPYPGEAQFFGKDGKFDSDGFSKAYEAWMGDIRSQERRYTGCSERLQEMFLAATGLFLSVKDNENRIFSPVNVGMALSMLCEMTDGNSRQQLLNLMGADGIETVRSQANAVWNANYRDDGTARCVLANSVWLNQKIGYVQTTVDRLAQDYYASVFSGQMGSPAYDKVLQDWLNAQTDGLLAQQAEGIRMDARTVIALASTINFRAKWSHTFSEKATAKRLFHSQAGDISCDFMNMSSSMEYWMSDKAGAVSLAFNDGCRMVLMLPHDGVSVGEIIADEQELKLLLSGFRTDNSKHLIVDISVPKFDVSSDLSLVDGLRALGVTDVFSFEHADFTPLTGEAKSVAVTSAKHAARVKIDEEGCTAVAYTVMAVCGAGRPPEERMDFVLDRPFVFAILSQNDLPLFIGTVHRPVN